MHNKINVIEQTFVTEISKLISVYGSISFFNKKSVNEKVHIVLFNNSLKFTVLKDTIKNTLDFQLTKIDGTLPKLNDKQIHHSSLTEVGKTRKAQMIEPIKTVIIRGQEKFGLHDFLNPVQIKINDDRILNILKKHKKYLLPANANRYFVSVIHQKQQRTDICNLQRAKQHKNYPDLRKNCKYTWNYKFK